MRETAIEVDDIVKVTILEKAKTIELFGYIQSVIDNTGIGKTKYIIDVGEEVISQTYSCGGDRIGNIFRMGYWKDKRNFSLTSKEKIEFIKEENKKIISEYLNECSDEVGNSVFLSIMKTMRKELQERRNLMYLVGGDKDLGKFFKIQNEIESLYILKEKIEKEIEEQKENLREV